MSIVAERVSLNPPAEDPTLQSLDFVGLDPSWGIYLLGHDYAPPQPEVIHAGSSDTDGDPVVSSKYGNRTITAKVRVFEPSDPAAVNLVPNPTAELGLENIANSGGTAPARMVDPLGTPSVLNLDTYWTGAAAAAGNFGCWEALSLTAAKTYTFSAYVKVTARTGAAALKLVIRKAAGAALASSAAIEAVSAEWVRLTVTFAVTETAATYRICLEQSGAGTIAWQATAAQAEEGAAATHYFDGDTPGCDWVAERNKSTSSRPAPDGTRFSRICRDVTRQIDRIRRTKEGTYRRISAQGGPMYFDLRVGAIAEAPTALDIQRKRGEYGLAFEALPGGRGAEELAAEGEGNGFLSLVIPGTTKGELESLGRFVVTDKSGQDQQILHLGTQFDTYSLGANSELFYKAETRTLLGGAALVEKATSYGAKVVESSALAPKFQAVLSTQATAAGSHLSHTGSYRVLARVYRPTGNTGAVTAKFVWTEGDFVNITENSAEQVEWAANENEGVWQVVDLGIVTINQAAPGTAQRWEGRVFAMSTAADRILIDALMFKPVSETAGTVTANVKPTPPVGLSGYDGFRQTAGALSGKSAGIGGLWERHGDAVDFALPFKEDGYVQRTEISDAEGVGVMETLGAKVYTDVVVAAHVNFGAPAGAYGLGPLHYGVLARWVDATHWAALVWSKFGVEPIGGLQYFSVQMILRNAATAGTPTVLSATGGLAGLPVGAGPTVFPALQLAITVKGEYIASAGGKQVLRGTNALFATGGALASGKVGLLDEHSDTGALNRYYENFEAWEGYGNSIDQAIYASKAFELRSDRARRQDREGVTWGNANYTGDYLRLPAAGPEKRNGRIFAKWVRSAEEDPALDAAKGQLFLTPRYLHAAPY